jgi:signal peptidase II
MPPMPPIPLDREEMLTAVSPDAPTPASGTSDASAPPTPASGSGVPSLAAGFHKLRYLFVSVAVLIADQWTKWRVEVHLPDRATEPLLPGFLNLTHVRNTGVAFGLFAAQGTTGGSWLLTLLGLAALTAVGVYFWFTPSRDRLLLVALALVVGGAVGNLIDRVVTGAVTDFIDVYVGFHHWPAFNVADSAISIGIALMAFDSLRPHRGLAHPVADAPPAGAGSQG